MTWVEVHTENGVEAPQPGEWRRAVLVALLVLSAVLGAALALWLSGIGDASAAGGCGG